MALNDQKHYEDEDYDVIIKKNGNTIWYKNGKRHRIGGPAFIHWDGSKEWYQNGKLHRKDGPAIIWNYGCKEWYQNGKLHCEDGPAIIWANGCKEWYQNGKRHRIGGPSSENIYYKHWYQNGKRHRVDGPAIILANGIKQWYINDQKHREDGPAFVNPNNKIKLWYYENKEYTQKEYNKLLKRKKDLARWVYQRWYSDFMRNPHTERGKKYIRKDYDRLMNNIKK